MCTENVKEKTELLYALISGRKLSDLPKINQVLICDLHNHLAFNGSTQHYACHHVPYSYFFFIMFNNLYITYFVNLAANLDNLGRARQSVSIRTWLTAAKVCLVTAYKHHPMQASITMQ